MNKFEAGKKVTFWRALVQWGFLAWIIAIGIRFGLFVRHFESGGAAPYVSRPPGVEGFLPIGALVSLKHWLVNGFVHDVHPAALVLFLTFLVMSLLAKKSFCSWLCPVGTLSEGAWKLGCRLFGRTFQPWRWLDTLLRSLKYLLLFFFAKIILLDMPARALGAFMDAPYWAVSDVKMLRFFTHMSLTALVVSLVLAGLSLLYQNFWCRYLCPYGALMGLASLLSPFKIRRNPERCTACGACSRACPAWLPVQHKATVRSPECTGCLTCVEACPERALAMAPPAVSTTFPRWVFPVLALSLYGGGVLLGMATGHWETSLTTQHYQQLIPLVPYLGH
ncbi:MAG: 4Fe-4S binding protein [Desulfuromonadales bacterium]|uniref:4Fe-4S binding protein n=1 Tax=Desulfuromonas sp. KJ2020 TaxID=2919173 RepID=UPI000320AA8A|nr:4Fe-4S binding protein [Desulfuromonas sp. KJ2020]MCP3176139.1 4Fe-4S binding protein [Desulfuromonas sp. KJ2020]